jgi:histidine triad (HIT) family protein
VFCAIMAGAKPGHIVFDGERVCALLDHRPLFPGHVLVVPRPHVASLEALPEELVGPLFSTTRWVALAVEAVMGAQGAFVGLNNKVSQSVPHVHVHVVPRSKGDGLKGFFWPRRPYRDAAHAEEVARRLRVALRELPITG